MPEGTETIEAGQLLGDDGVFQENWQSLAFPDDTDPHKTDQTLAQIKDIRTLARQVVSGESTIGKLSGGREFAILPNEQSDEAEIKAYRTKTGVPDNAGDYKLNELALPEGLPKDEKLAEHMGNVLHKAGASTAIAVAVHNGYAEYIKSSLEAATTQDKLDAQEANKELRSKLGAAYDKTMRDITAIVTAFGNPIDAAETATLIKELPYDSFATQLLGKIAEKFTEKSPGEPPIPPTGELTPTEALSKINEIMKDPYYVTDSPAGKPRNKAYHDELIEKVKKLFEVRTNTG